MEAISNNARFVWVRGKKYQVIYINQKSRFVNAFCGDYARMGNAQCFHFDEIEKVEF